MNSNKKIARTTGLLYLAVVVTGIFSLMYVPSQLIIWDNPEVTFTNIANNQQLFRLGIVSSIACYTFFIFLPLSFYKLLEPISKSHARAMVILAVVSVPISFVNLLNKFAALSLTSGQKHLSVYSNDELQAQVMHYLIQYDNGILIVQVFWGLWLFPLGYLVFKSGILPKLLGILLMLGCFSYLINFLGHSIMNNYSELGISSYVRLPASLGEIGICLWLLVFGARETKIVK
jgi:hypothetical protein